MPEFDVLQQFQQTKQALTPQIDSFNVERDRNFVGYKVNLNWSYDEDDILGFKVWRSRSQKVLLRKNYVIDQTALERISGLTSFPTRNTALFNKQYFSQNSKLKFFQSNSTRFDKPDETNDVTIHRFSEVGFVQRDSDGQYSFCDRRVKFGETYFYVIAAVNTHGFESPKSNQCTVCVEDLNHPDSPSRFDLSLGPSSISVVIGTKIKAKDVKAFKIFRKLLDNKKREFEEVAEVATEATDFVDFLDFNVIPGRRYEYKVYSIDLFGNLSFSASASSIAYPVGFDRKGDVPDPDVKIEIDENGHVIFTGEKNHPKIVGLEIERRDAWRFEQKFERKTFVGKPWPGVNAFDASGSMEFIDRTADLGRVYQYRITTIRNNGRPATYLVTPHIRIERGFQFPSGTFGDFETPSSSLERLTVDVADSKQEPVYTQLSWSISGAWDYLVLDIRDPDSDEEGDNSKSAVSVKIDNIPGRNDVHIDELERDNSYIITGKVYLDDELVAQSDSSLNTVRVTI